MEPSYFDLAAEALARALTATGIAEQGQLLEEALRLNRLALAQERQRLAETAAHSDGPSASRDGNVAT